jgi:hypothetical protein
MYSVLPAERHHLATWKSDNRILEIKTKREVSRTGSNGSRKGKAYMEWPGGGAPLNKGDFISNMDPSVKA